MTENPSLIYEGINKKGDVKDKHLLLTKEKYEY